MRPYEGYQVGSTVSKDLRCLIPDQMENVGFYESERESQLLKTQICSREPRPGFDQEKGNCTSLTFVAQHQSDGNPADEGPTVIQEGNGSFAIGPTSGRPAGWCAIASHNRETNLRQTARHADDPAGYAVTV